MEHQIVDAARTIARTTPGSLGPSSRRIHLATGVELHYVEQGDPAGSPLILLHGGTDSWHSWELILPRISRAYHAYALDQRGHGESGKPDSGYAVADFARDVVAFMDALGIARAAVVG